MQGDISTILPQAFSPHVLFSLRTVPTAHTEIHQTASARFLPWPHRLGWSTAAVSDPSMTEIMTLLNPREQMYMTIRATRGIQPHPADVGSDAVTTGRGTSRFRISAWGETEHVGEL